MELRKHLVDGMGKDFGLDFRPKNHFGITGITITDPGTREADCSPTEPGWSGVTPRTTLMATMLERGSDVANGVLVDDTVKVIQRMLAYSKAFEPLMHTGVVFADVVARTQRQMPAHLLDRCQRHRHRPAAVCRRCTVGTDGVLRQRYPALGRYGAEQFHRYIAGHLDNFFPWSAGCSNRTRPICCPG